MPDLASRRLASTSCVLLPMDETMPIPVTTTRRIAVPTLYAVLVIGPQFGRPRQFRKGFKPSSAARLQRLILLEQSDLEIKRLVNDGAVRRQPAIGYAKHQLRAHHALEIDAVDHLFHRRQHLAGEFQFAQAQGAAAAGRAAPAEHQLPGPPPPRVAPRRPR